MHRTSKTQGFHIVEVVLVIVLLGVLGLVGWRVWEARQKTASSQTPASQAASVPPIANTAGLDQVDVQANQVDADSGLTDLTKLDQDLNAL